MPRDVSKRTNRVTRPQAQSAQRMTFEELMETAGDVKQYREYMTATEADKAFGITSSSIDPDGEYVQWVRHLSQNEITGIRNYTGEYFTQMNSALRANRIDDPFIKKQIDEAQSALLKSEILDGITVFRDTGYNMFGGLTTAADIEAAFKGKVTLERAFLSGSAAMIKNYDNSKPVRVAIHYAPGTYGQYVDPVSAHKGEKEFLGAAGQHWVLNFAREANGRIYADITVLEAGAVDQYTKGTGGRDAQTRGAYYNQKKSV